MRRTIPLGAVIGVALAGSAGGVAAAETQPAAPSPPPSGAHPPPAEPIRDGDRLIYPEGALIPRSLTEVERRYLRDFPLGASPGLRGPNPPPDGPVYCVPEYAPMEGLLIAWEAFSTLQTQMVQQITSSGAGVVYIVCDSTAEQSSVQSALAAAINPAVNLSLVRYVVRTTDTVWIRDYGPRYIYQGTPGHQCRAIVDHVYNRPRPNDDAFPPYFSTQKGHALYSIPLVHGGGNFHLDGLGRAYATRLVANENPSLSDGQIIGYWQSFQNVLTTLVTPFPTSVDATQHIDMWMQIIDDTKVVISDWPNNPGSTQDQICDAQAAAMAAAGYTVYRTPAYSIGGVHYTYTNMVMCNNLVLLPLYTATPAGANAAALATLQGALPGRQVVQLNCDAIAPYAGVMHCIVMHVPVPTGVPGVGGQAPVVYLRTLRGAPAQPPLTPGSVVPVSFVSDDDRGVTTFDVRLSHDGGATFPTVLAQNLPVAAGGATTWSWVVPDRFIRAGRVRVVVRDADGNSSWDQSAGDIRIAGSCRADWTGDGAVTPADVASYVNTWAADLAAGSADSNFDADPAITPADVAAFVLAWFDAAMNGC